MCNKSSTTRNVLVVLLVLNIIFSVVAIMGFYKIFSNVAAIYNAAREVAVKAAEQAASGVPVSIQDKITAKIPSADPTGGPFRNFYAVPIMSSLFGTLGVVFASVKRCHENSAILFALVMPVMHFASFIYNVFAILAVSAVFVVFKAFGHECDDLDTSKPVYKALSDACDSVGPAVGLTLGGLVPIVVLQMMYVLFGCCVCCIIRRELKENSSNNQAIAKDTSGSAGSIPMQQQNTRPTTTTTTTSPASVSVMEKASSVFDAAKAKANTAMGNSPTPQQQPQAQAAAAVDISGLSWSIFQYFDLNKDMNLQWPEFLKLVEKIGWNQQSTESAWYAIDQDRNGHLSWEEFVRFASQNPDVIVAVDKSLRA